MSFRWRRTAVSLKLAVNFGAEVPFFDPVDASTGEAVAAAGSFTVR